MVIHVAIGIAMNTNPGYAVIAAAVMRQGTPVRTCRVESIVTCNEAYWMALEMALDRLNGRAAVIHTNSTIIARTNPYRIWRWSHSYEESANRSLQRLRETGSEVRHTRTKDLRVQTSEANWVRWVSAQAVNALRDWQDVLSEVSG